MIRISKNGVEYTYNSLSNACKENGNSNPMNSNACKKYLEKQGFDLTTLIEEEGKVTTGTGTASTSSKHALIERIIKQAVTVNKDEVNQLTNELNTLVKNLKTGDDINKIIELNQKIESASNPKPDLDTVIGYVTNLFYEYMLDKNTQATE